MDSIQKHTVELKKLCEHYNVDKMYLFGSALNSNFNENSDLDFLVCFKPIELSGYFENYMDFKESLQNLFNRKVDLLEEQALKNPVLIKSIYRNKELVYG